MEVKDFADMYRQFFGKFPVQETDAAGGVWLRLIGQVQRPDAENLMRVVANRMKGKKPYLTDFEAAMVVLGLQKARTAPVGCERCHFTGRFSVLMHRDIEGGQDPVLWDMTRPAPAPLYVYAVPCTCDLGRICFSKSSTDDRTRDLAMDWWGSFANRALMHREAIDVHMEMCRRESWGQNMPPVLAAFRLQNEQRKAVQARLDADRAVAPGVMGQEQAFLKEVDDAGRSAGKADSVDTRGDSPQAESPSW